MLALCLPGILLGIFSWKHYRDGIALDRAIPVPVYMTAQIEMPKAAYVEAAKALNNVDERNGNGLLTLAETLIRSGQPATRTLSVLRAGLERSPASSRGWTLLAERYYRSNNRLAAKALSQALILAPRDYWLVGARVQDANILWSYLDSDTKKIASAQTVLLWQEPQLHEQLRTVVRTSPKMIERSFGSEDIREINRWMAREQEARP
jgi:hypothetical protein